jgi:hypothetical protein
MIRVEAESAADPRTAWALLARPDRWHRWAPHVRGAVGLGSPEVTAGSRGAALLAGVVPIPARITAKEEGTWWAWRVGPLDIGHQVLPRNGGCTVAAELHAPGRLEPLVGAAYGPIVRRLVSNLAREAERTALASETTPS